MRATVATISKDDFTWPDATKAAGLEREPSEETKKRTVEILRSMRPIATPEDFV